MTIISNLNDLVGFLRRFHAYDKPSDSSCIPSEFPPSLATFYSELGGLIDIEPSIENSHRAPLAAQDAFTPLERIEYVDDMVEFAWENQGNWSARCSFDPNDSKVYSNAAESWGEGSGFEPVCDSLSHFITTLALQEAVMSCPNLVSTGVDEISKAIDAKVDSLWLNGHFVYGEPTHDFYYDLEHDMIAMNWGGIWIGSHNSSFRNLLKSDIGLTEIH